MKPKQSSILRKIFLYISILCILEIWFISTIAIGHGNDEGSVNNGSISQYSLIGTYTGCIKELRGDGETPFTIVITSDTANKHPIYGTVWHHIGGTVTLSSFPPYIFQTTFSPEIAGQYTGFWREMDFFGLIIAKGEKVSKVTLTFLISPNLNQIKITVGCFKFGAFDRKCNLTLYDAILDKNK